MSRTIIGMLSLLFCISVHADGINEVDTQVQQSAQETCVQQRVNQCMDVCIQNSGANCGQQCEENSKNECQQAGE